MAGHLLDTQSDSYFHLGAVPTDIQLPLEKVIRLDTRSNVFDVKKGTLLLGELQYTKDGQDQQVHGLCFLFQDVNDDLYYVLEREVEAFQLSTE